MYFDEKLKALRLKQNLSLAELSNKLQIPENVLDCLETGFRDPNDEEMNKISCFFGVAQTDLADDQPAANALSILFRRDVFPSSDQPAATTVPPADAAIRKIPLSVVSSEEPSVVRQEQEHWLPVFAKPEDEYAAITVQDDNLADSGILAGDIAIIRLKNSVPAGTVAAVRQDGKLVLRRTAEQEQIYGQVTEIRRILYQGD